MKEFSLVTRPTDEQAETFLLSAYESGLAGREVLDFARESSA